MPVYADVTERVAHAGHADVVYTLAPGSGSRFYSAGSEGIVAEWDAATGTAAGAVLRAPQAVFSLCCVVEEGLLAVGQVDGGLHLFDLAARQVRKSVQVHNGSIFDIVWLPRQRSLLACGGDGRFSIWPLASLQPELVAVVGNERLRCAAVSPDGMLLALGSSDGYIRLYHTEGLTLLDQWPAHETTVFTLAFHPDGRHLVSGGRDAHLRLWLLGDVAAPAVDVVAHTLGIHHLAFSPDAKWLATASMDKSWKLWTPDLQLRKVVDNRRHAAHRSSVNRVLWLPHHPEDADYRLVTGSDDRLVLQWSVRFRA